nr:growth-regulating factor 6-like [Physcomitrium patens]|eukprot:XP_024390741.1 growth-regulating factor 6-like [Physcomitrella patens]
MSSPNSPGSLSPNNHRSSLKHCRSASDMDLEDRRGGGPLKVSRTDSFHRQSDLKMHMNGSPSGTMVLSSSMVSDGRLGCSPTNSCASDGSLLGNDQGNVVSDARLLRQDSLVAASGYSGGQGGGRPLSYHHLQSSSYHYKPSGGGLSMGRESMNHMGQSVHNPVNSARAPFTTSQWAELEHQALIFKYMMAGVNVPQELLNPIRKSVATMNGLASHHTANLGWGAFHLGVPNNTDPEPGRCRRTDGKKWRCARDVVPDQKYCERHMHRGRHRSRRPAEGQTSSASQSGSVASSAPQPAIAVGASRTSTPTPGTSLTHSNLRPAILTGNSQSTSNLGGGGMGYNSPGGSGGLSGGSSPAASPAQFQLPVLSSATGSSGLTSKDYRLRYMNGMAVKSEMGMGPEQVLFSEASGSTRGLSQEAQSLSNLSRLNTPMNKAWQTMTSSKVLPAAQSKGSGSSSLLSFSSPQMGGLLGQEFGLMPETSQVNLAAMAASQQQHSFLSNGYGGVESTSVGRESSEGQPLRHFFDDWPRSRDPSALAWGSDVEDSDRTTSAGRGGQSNRASNNTQLSISIPMTAAPSGDFNSQSSGGSPSRGKLSLSPLKFSISRAGDASSDMGLDVENLRVERHHDWHRHTTAWDSMSWEPISVGGPLAEVLQLGSTTQCGGGGGGVDGSGPNLLADEWLDLHQKKSASPVQIPSPDRVASPVDVLQISTFASHSDSSNSNSGASSPSGALPFDPASTISEFATVIRMSLSSSSSQNESR